MAKIVPVTKIEIDENMNKGPLPITNAESGTPRALNPNK
jgi:hypothetical protein